MGTVPALEPLGIGASEHRRGPRGYRRRKHTVRITNRIYRHRTALLASSPAGRGTRCSQGRAARLRGHVPSVLGSWTGSALQPRCGCQSWRQSAGTSSRLVGSALGECAGLSAVSPSASFRRAEDSERSSTCISNLSSACCSLRSGWFGNRLCRFLEYNKQIA